MKNPMSSMYPAGPNNNSGKRSTGLSKQINIVNAILVRLAVLKKNVIKSLVNNRSERAFSIKGNSLSFLENDLLSSNLRLYSLIFCYIFILSYVGYSSCLNTRKIMLTSSRHRGHFIFSFVWANRLSRHCPQNECPQVIETWNFLSSVRHIQHQSEPRASRFRRICEG